jgi:PKD repeat protein
MIKRLATLSALAVAVVMAACTVHQSDSAPPLTGPSEFAQSITITSNPDRLTQDGQSQSAITVKVFDATGSAAVGVPIRLDMLVDGTLVDFGTLSARNLVTGGDGRATAVYTAAPAPPPASQGSNTVTIRAIAVGSNAQTSNGGFSTDIRLVPPGVILPPAGTPTASFTFSPSPASLNVPLNFNASASLPGTNAILVSYQWSFGDGSSASGRTISKTFTTPGTFNVTLTVTNDRGLAASTTQAVSVGTTTAPTAAFTFSPTAPAVLQNVNFNAAASAAAPGRSIASYSWNFGDGSATKTGVTAQHDFGVAGTYSVTLTVTDDVGQRSTATQSVSVTGGAGGGTPTPPTASFVFSPTAPQVNQTINFNADASRPGTGRTIVSYGWNFGDGTTISLATTTTTHAFTAAGTYNVTLTVTDDVGQKGTATQPVTITGGPGGGGPTAPTPAFTYSPAAPGVGETVFFNGSTSSASAGRSIASYSWIFGDGSTGTGLTPTHQYMTAGTYGVQLTVTDNGVPPLSATSAATLITVGNPPSPTARFTFSPTSPVVGQPVVFDSAGSTTAQGQTITKYEWNFGDGTGITTCNVPAAAGDAIACTGGANRTIAHQFAAVGTYTVNLVVTDSAGRIGSTAATVTVFTANPTARLTLTKAGALNITADGSTSTATGTAFVVTYRFAWGDGLADTVGGNPTVPHSYLSGGTYTVLLTVVDNLGRLGTASQTITVP